MLANNLTHIKLLARNLTKSKIIECKINKTPTSHIMTKIFREIASKITYKKIVKTITRHKITLDETKQTKKTRLSFTDKNNKNISMNNTNKQKLLEDTIKLVQSSKYIKSFYIKIRLSSNELIYYQYN
jgi:hypothetical protein